MYQKFFGRALMCGFLNPQIGQAWKSAEAKLSRQEHPLQFTEFQGIANQHTLTLSPLSVFLSRFLIEI